MTASHELSTKLGPAAARTAPPAGRMPFNGVKSQLCSSALAEGLAFSGSVIISILLNRALLPEGRGLLAAIGSAISIAVAAGGFSIAKSCLYFFNRPEVRRSDLVGTICVLWPFMAVAAIAAFLAIAPAVVTSGLPILLLACGSVVFLQSQDIAYGALRAERCIHTLNAARSLHQLARLGVIIALFAVGWLSFPSALAVDVLLQCLLALGLVTVAARRLGLAPTFGRAHQLSKQLMKYGVPYQVSSLLWIVHIKADVLLVELWKGSTNAGVYATAVNLADILGRLPAVIIFVVSPYIAQMRVDGEALAYTARVCRMTLPVAIAMAIVVALLAPEIVVSLYGSAFRDSATSLRAILPGSVSAGLFQIAGGYLLVRGQFRPLIAVHVAALALNLLLNLILIERYSAVGAAVASSISYSCVLGSILAYLCRSHNVPLSSFIAIRKSDFLGEKK